MYSIILIGLIKNNYYLHNQTILTFNSFKEISTKSHDYQYISHFDKILRPKKNYGNKYQCFQ
jgi:hypothetical protein